MPKKRFRDEQISFSLRQAEAGTTVGEICRKMGISEATFYRWEKVYAGMGVSEIRRLKLLEDENGKLKRLVADPTLDKTMLQNALRKKWLSLSAAARLSGTIKMCLGCLSAVRVMPWASGGLLTDINPGCLMSALMGPNRFIY
ncbi:transposase [Aliiroseovarius sp. PrR006]|nr:transposase [Aliiroseovarius sp. PrR006]